MELHTIGIDLGKTVFHLVGLNLIGAARWWCARSCLDLNFFASQLICTRR